VKCRSPLHRRIRKKNHVDDSSVRHLLKLEANSDHSNPEDPVPSGISPEPSSELEAGNAVAADGRKGGRACNMCEVLKGLSRLAIGFLITLFLPGCTALVISALLGQVSSAHGNGNEKLDWTATNGVNTVEDHRWWEMRHASEPGAERMKFVGLRTIIVA
jgi:hypothetical protein